MAIPSQLFYQLLYGVLQFEFLGLVHNLHVCYHAVALYLCFSRLLGRVVNAYALVTLGGGASGYRLQLSLERYDLIG